MWNDRKREESLLQAINRQRTLLEQQVGPLELFRDGWSPNSKALMDVLYGFSTVLGSSPARFMVRGYLDREMGVIGHKTALARLNQKQKSALLAIFFDDVRYGEMEWQLRKVLTLLKENDVKRSFEKRMEPAVASGVLSVSDAAEASKSNSYAAPQNKIDHTLTHTNMTTIAVAGSILLLIYVLNVASETEQLPELDTEPSIPVPDYDQILTSLIDELKMADVRQKGVAFSALGQIGQMREKVMQALTKSLDRDDSKDRRNAAWAIARNISTLQERGEKELNDYLKANPELLSSLKQAIKDPIPRVACNAALAIAGLGTAAKEVVPTLNKRLSDVNVTQVFRLALASIEYPDPGLKADLAERIGEEDPLLDIGMRIEGRDFGGFDYRGGGGACMCTFS